MTRASTIALAGCICALALAQTPASLARTRGTLEPSSAQLLVVRDAAGTIVSLPIAADVVVSEVAPIDPSAIQPGVFLGTTAMPGPDGALSAVEVHVLPASSRGRGEGHRVIDGRSGATMTNGTVAGVKPGTAERTMTLHYADGEKTVRVPEGVPILEMSPGSRALLVPGAKVTVTTQLRDGRQTAVRVIVGKGGYEPPL